MTILNFQATIEQIRDLFNEMKAGGATITEKVPGMNLGQAWTLAGHGVTADVSYVEPTLTVTVVSKPFFVTINEIKCGILEALQKSLADTQMKA
jgi:hypothetical protein